MSAKSMLAFLRNGFKDMPMKQMTEIVLSIFYQSVFSLQIFNYKASHEGVLMRFSNYVRYVEPDRPNDNMVSIVLPKLFLKPATFGQV